MLFFLHIENINDTSFFAYFVLTVTDEDDYRCRKCRCTRISLEQNAVAFTIINGYRATVGMGVNGRAFLKLPAKILHCNFDTCSIHRNKHKDVQIQ